jgi:MFS family permease
MSIVFSVAMVAFLVVEPPVGYISDMWLGEKEIMIGGFVILVVTTAALPLLAGASVLAWALLMFATRVGAASIEMTTESYFFKHVDSTNLVQVSAYRILSAAARIVVPLLGVFFLTFLPITYMPIALALCIALIASIELPGLVDTR